MCESQASQRVDGACPSLPACPFCPAGHAPFSWAAAGQGPLGSPIPTQPGQAPGLRESPGEAPGIRHVHSVHYHGEPRTPLPQRRFPQI